MYISNIKHNYKNMTFFAKQAIHGINKKIQGYELLYRESKEVNYFTCSKGVNPSEEIIKMIMRNKSYFERDLYFINIDEEIVFNMLDEIKEINSKNIVFELLETSNFSDPNFYMMLLYLKRKFNFSFALDDVSEFNEYTLSYVSLCDYIKIDFLALKDKTMLDYVINSVKVINPKCKILIEKIETQSEYETIKKNNDIELIQGYYFSYPKNFSL